MKTNKKVTVELEFEQEFSSAQDNFFKLSTSNQNAGFPVEFHAYSRKELDVKFFAELIKFINQVEKEWSKNNGA